MSEVQNLGLEGCDPHPSVWHGTFTLEGLSAKSADNEVNNPFWAVRLLPRPEVRAAFPGLNQKICEVYRGLSKGGEYAVYERVRGITECGTVFTLAGCALANENQPAPKLALAIGAPLP